MSLDSSDLPLGLERGVGALVACAQHPAIETSLRCIRCGRAICPRCLTHTVEGAVCPRCARVQTPRQLVLAPLRLLLALPAGLAAGAVAGAVLTLMPFGAILVLPTLVFGFVVGEVMAAGRAPGGLFLALMAFMCCILGPLMGRAAIAALMTAESAPSLMVALESVGPFGVLLLVVAASLGGIRAGSSRADLRQDFF